MKTLSLYAVEAIDHLVQPADFDDTTLLSPALSVVTDFKHSQPNILSAATKACDAQDMMQQEHSRLKLVVDDSSELVGLLHLEQLSEQTLMRHIALGVNRDDIRVADVMRPRERIKALAYQQLQHCNIADVVNTLQSSGEQHCVVIDRESHQIRGVISAQDIARRLKVQLTIAQTPTFLHIFDSLTA
ncbi:CBS domain-containing protein [Rheinheimera maricola]|uniref:CBS domain-containing protein n=1 Tax=Rheinheimera maricola TaxID=2793282 RepID=A0ABS7XCU8_9GAMM|nr:CBS domain-containing protein [Rheinheimera maricola]MBZ9612437.1 CBS domain-containing protein [Rheinheimera maricola]